VGRDVSGRFVTQETRSFEPSAEQTAENAAFLQRYLPGAVGPESPGVVEERHGRAPRG